MNAAALFSGGKDSVYATYLAREHDIDISCLLTIYSENKESYMFHTPSITEVEKQAEVMNLPLLKQTTKGEKEKELIELEQLIRRAKNDFNIQAVITGAVESAYQASRVQKICDTLNIDCFNPLWQKNQEQIIQDLIQNNFDSIITGIFAYPLTEQWLGRHIDSTFLKDVKQLNKQYQIHIAGEGGEFETFVLNCPLFKRALTITQSTIKGKANSWSMEIEVS